MARLARRWWAAAVLVLAAPVVGAASPGAPAFLQPWLTLREAQNALSEHKLDEAQALLDRAEAARIDADLQKRERTRFDLDLLTARTRLHVARNDWAATAATAKARVELAHGDERAAALLDLYTAHASAGDAPAARGVAARLLVDHVSSPAGRTVERAPGPTILSPVQRAQRIQNLIVASRMERALSEARAAPRPELGLDEPLEIATITALVRNGKEQEAARYAAPLAERPGAGLALKKAHAWAVGKAGRAEEASRLYEALVDPLDDPEAKGDVCFLSGFLAYEAHDFARADARLAACATVLEGHSREAAALWYRAWMALQQQKPEARLLLDRLLTKYPSDAEVHKHRYWSGVAAARAGDDQAARRAWDQILRQNPLGYYGLLARRRRGLPPLVMPKVAAPDTTARRGKDAATVEARALFEAGFAEAARAHARDRARGRLRDVARAQSVGDFFYGYRNGPRQLPHPRVKGHHVRGTIGWRASYAEPHRDIVRPAAARHGLAPSLAYAIMRTESGFLEDAVSVAGAVGLMQLMPYSARGMAKALGQEPPAFLDVQDKARVIDLGIAFLARSQKEFGTLWLAAACYNGAPQNVAQWMDKHRGQDPVTFIENIPFRETRNYAKKILASEAVYRGLSTGTVQMALDESRPVPAAPARYTWFPPTDNE